MANLAIKGHPTRGNEVIEILEMLGGKNINNYAGTFNECYVINYNKICTIYTSAAKNDVFVIFTLEEFEERYPYKVGDKVIIKSNNQEAIVTEVTWEYNTIMYRLKQNDDFLGKYITYELQPYKEETMEEELMPKIDFSKYCKNKYLLDMGDYEIKVEDGKTYVVRKRTQYPKTYEECCEVIGLTGCMPTDNLWYKFGLILAFYRLLICRDAYWKIAGEEMGLGKPWEPDFTNDEERYGIYTTANKVVKDFCGVGDVNMILTFPTEEMRDLFYENFKDLIEQCKELL